MRTVTRCTAVLMVVLMAGCSDLAAEDTSADRGPTTTFEMIGPDSDTLLLNTEYVGWQICSGDPEQVYAEAGTRDVGLAADWYSEGSTADHQPYAKRGCVAGLTGGPPPAGYCAETPAAFGC